MQFCSFSSQASLTSAKSYGDVMVKGPLYEVTGEGKELRCLPHWAPSSTFCVVRQTSEDEEGSHQRLVPSEKKKGKGVKKQGMGMKGHENRIYR